MTRMIDIARECLGEFADRAIQNGAVVPLTDKKKPLVKWGSYVDPHKDYAFGAIAVKTGHLSGLTVIDYDSEFPSVSNVKTKRGGHVWVSWDNDRTRQYRDAHIDIRGSGGLAVFHSQNHKVLHRVLADRSDYTSLLSSPTSTTTASNSKYQKREEGTAWEYVTPRASYLETVSEAGYEIDVERAVDALAKQVAAAQEGSRNITLYRNLGSVMALGGDTKRVIDAAFKAGLEGPEIYQTLASVEKSGSHIDVFALANLWMDSAEAAMQSPVIPVLAKHAIEQHSLRPQFNQVQFCEDYSQNRMTTSRHLKRLEQLGKVQKIDGGFREGHIRHPNNYRLILPGQGKEDRS